MAAGEPGADYVLFGEPDAQRPAALGGGDCRAPAMVGRAVRAALRRLCRLAREALPSSLPPARILSWSAISSGPIRAAPRRRLTDAGRAIAQPVRSACRNRHYHCAGTASRARITPEMSLLRPISRAGEPADDDGRRHRADLAGAACRAAARERRRQALRAASQEAPTTAKADGCDTDASCDADAVGAAQAR